jgi:hypothetical protein
MQTKTLTTEAEGSVKLDGSVTAERRLSCNSARSRSSTSSTLALAHASGARPGLPTASGCAAEGCGSGPFTLATSWHLSLEWA